MGWLAAIGELVLGFVVGTWVLWFCSRTVNTSNTSIKTAAIYNAIMTVVEIVFLIMTAVALAVQPEGVEAVMVALMVLGVVISFLLLMRLYRISFLATAWLVIAMGVIRMGVEFVVDLVSSG